MKAIRLFMKAFLMILAVMFAVMLTTAALFFSVNGREQADQERQYPADGGKRALVLYQDSRFGGTGRAVERAIAALQDEGCAVTRNHPRADSPYDAQDYDIIVLASPVYAGQVSAPLLRYAQTQDFTGKTVLILLTGFDLQQTAELNEVKQSVHGASLLYGIKVDRADERIEDAARALAACA
ncbi:MAG: flavodoxin family protein [Candidatus Spyradocola sp.]